MLTYSRCTILASMRIITQYIKCSHVGRMSRDGFAEVFEGRLAALGRADRLMSQRPEGVSLKRLLDQELAGATAPSRYSLEGQGVVLHSDCALAFSLLVHELTANAKEHGSLSVETGRVDVSWHLDDGDLILTWIESGGPPARSPLAPGFGNLLVTYTAVKLKGTVDHLYNQSGLTCTVRISLLARWPYRHGSMLLGLPDACAVRALVQS
jgi:two-component sensor histidine kinase